MWATKMGWELEPINNIRDIAQKIVSIQEDDREFQALSE